MGLKAYPVIDLAATGDNIRRLRMARGLTVRDLQSYFGFAEPRAIYKWQKGETLPTVDNLYALGALLDVSLEQILIPVGGVTGHGRSLRAGKEITHNFSFLVKVEDGLPAARGRCQFGSGHGCLREKRV